MTETQLNLLIVPGSLRASSHNAQLARRAAALAPAGVTATVYTGLGSVEPFDEDVEVDAPAGVRAWRGALRAADVVLFVTPEYNSSIPGQLKNALDWASRADGVTGGPLADNALYGRHTAVISASTGQFGGVWAQAETIKVLKALGARVVEEGSFSLPNAATAFAEDGTLASETKTAQLEAWLAATLDKVQLFQAA